MKAKPALPERVRSMEGLGVTLLPARDDLDSLASNDPTDLPCTRFDFQRFKVFAMSDAKNTHLLALFELAYFRIGARALVWWQRVERCVVNYFYSVVTVANKLCPVHRRTESEHEG